ncbi:GEVED domain-containing protein [Flavobacterium akiainvivens]|nr:GEVED domain-containing protein [Flavobacterium akiainvivens]
MKINNLIVLLLMFCPLVVMGQTPPTCTVGFSYSEGFNTSTISNCWSQAQVSGATSSNSTITSITSSPSGPTLQTYDVYEGGRCLRFRSSLALAGVQSRIMSSAFNTVGKMNITLKFMLWHTNESAFASFNDRVQVQYSTNGTTWQNAGNEMVVYNSATNGWSEKTIVLPSGAQGATTLYVALLFTSANGANAYVDYVRLTAEEASVCTGTPAPGNTLSSVSSVCAGSNFTLSLQNATTGSGVSYQWQSSSNQTTWANISGATASTLTTTQNASTYYRCNVTCSGNTGASNPVQVITEQLYAALPYTESFESWQSKCDGTSNVPSQYWMSTPSAGNNSWRRNDQGSSSASWSSNSGAYSPVSQTGSYSARFHTYNTSSGTQGALDLYADCSSGSSSKRLTFYYINTSGSDKVEVYVSTNGGQTFTKIGADIVTSSSWALQTRDFTSSSAQTVVRLIATSDFGSTDIGIDNLMLDYAPSCMPPTGLTTVSVAVNTANISWTAPATAPASGYDYYYSTSSATPAETVTASGSTNAGVASVSLSALNEATTYYVWVRSKCSASEKSAWSSVLSFTTSCATAAVPYYLTFDDVTAPALPGCITQENTTADSYYWRTSSSYKHSGTNSAYMPSNYTQNDYLYTKGINLTAGTAYRLSFRYLVGYSSNYKANIAVAYSSQAASTATQVNLLTLTNLQGVSMNTAFTLQYVDFTPQTSGVYYISFRAYNQADVYIDAVSVEIAPTCIEPANLAVGTITANSATVSWQAASPVPGNGYEYYLSTSSTAPVAATAATGTATGTSVTLSNLTADTTYYVWVRSVCSGSDKSAWTLSPVTLFTGYCSVSTTSSTDYISAFSTTGAVQNINYTATTQPAGSYSNQSQGQAIQQYTGLGFNFSSTYSGGNNGINIWVDWNNDLVFSDSEKVLNLANSNVTKTGTVNIPAGTLPGNYRLRVRAQWGSSANPAACGSVSYGSTLDFTLTVLPACNTWTGAVSNNWSTAGNWCGGVVPGATADVVINGSNTPEISTATATVKSLTIEQGATVTIKTGGTLTVNNALVNNGSIVVENNAALVQATGSIYTQSAGATAVVYRDSNPLYRLDYTLWGSPVAGQNLFAFSDDTAVNRFYTYGLNTNGEENYLAVPDPAAINFAPATGYLIRMPNNLPDVTGYNTGDATHVDHGVFTGTLNNGTVGAEAGNLVNHYIAVANPYASPISVVDFFTQNSGVLEAGEGIYFWRKKNNALATSYAHLSMAGFTANSAAGGNIENGGAYYYGGNTTGSTNFNENWIISPAQGFLVKLKSGISATSKVNFTNSMRRGVPAIGQPFFRTQNNNDAPAVSRWWINLTGADVFSQSLVSYMPQATTGLDYGYDARAISDGPIALYSKEAEDNLAIQARPAFEVTDVVPMGFNITTAGEYTLALDHVDGQFAQGQDIFVKDNLLGTVHNLQDGAYTFTSGAGSFDTRFEVLYQTDGELGTNQPELANMVLVYQQNGAINITSGSVEMTGVTLYDIRGRKLYEQNGINATQTSVSNLAVAQQVIIVEIQTVNGTVSKKIVY